MDRKRTPPELTSLLRLSPSESTPPLLELARLQAGRKKPRDLLAQLGRDRFVHPSFLDLRLAHRLDGLALEAARDFDAVLLSPVAPLGTCSVLAPTSQDRTLTTTRGSEVVSDPTNVLALLCAERLREDARALPRLCTVHQVLRAQALPPRPGFSRHFRLFALAEAGLGRAEDGFEVEAVVRHVSVFDRLFDLASNAGYQFPRRALTMLARDDRKVLRERVKAALALALPHVEIREQALESPYYDGLRVLFGANSRDGEHVQVGDTGVFDWLGRLTADARMRFVASGLGIQLFPVLFAASEPPLGNPGP